MTAERLRQAAALMRKRAEAATPGPWMSQAGGYVLPPPPWVVGRGWTDSAVTKPGAGSPQKCSADAEHIASWHPRIAHAVAFWLEAEADAHTHAADGAAIDIWSLPGMDRHPALLLANAYLADDGT